MKTLMYLCLCLLLLILALVTSSLFFLPQITRYALPLWLEKQGFEKIHFEMSPVAMDRIHLNQLCFSQTDVTQTLHICLDNSLLSFNLKPLLQQQSLPSLHIEHASIQIEQHVLSEQETQFDLWLSEFINTERLPLLPLEHLEIEKLTFEWQNPNQHYEIEGRLSLNDERWYSNLHVRQQGQSLIDAEIKVTQSLETYLLLNYEDRPLYEMSGHLAHQEDHWLLNLGHILHADVAINWLQTQHEITIDLPEFKQAQLIGSTHILLPDYWQGSLIESLSQIQIDASLGIHLDLSTPHLQSQTAQLMLNATARLESGQLKAQLIEGASIHLNELTFGDFYTPSLYLQLLSNLEFEFDLLHGEPWRYGPSRWIMNGQQPQLKALDDLQALPLLLSLEAGDANTGVKGRASIPSLRISPPGRALPILSIEGPFQLNKTRDSITGSASVKTQDLPLQLDANYQYNTQGAGFLNWTLARYALQGQTPVLRRFLPELPAKLDLAQGNLTHNASLRFSANRWSLQANTELTSGVVNYGEIYAQNVDWKSQFSLDSTGQFQDQGNLLLEYANIGLPITSSGIRYQYRGNTSNTNTHQLRLESQKLFLLGGEIYLPAIQVNPLNPNSIFLVSIRDIQLSSILELYAQQGLYGEGTIDGQLPIQITPLGISITRGNLGSVIPGVIRYTPSHGVGAAASSNIGLRLALDALTDLRYTLLDLEVNYQPSGDAHLIARLQGNNPNWQQGRPIDLTLSVEENILDLLTALQISNRITDSLDRRFRR
ncbi:YdbH domain-containing protein [Nitrincola nitratireducens]|uniref:Uncharacterized protein n=1 Tax=Nitrincola nitratireducens TaxID=1229521 RepID=W9V7G4_9GAMM|nr:YdbH domain-containing protein [Nitrincola nitratireducens]EXJ12811.1 hypothetical protein D791_00153 [Nitrincola nitratireducens]